MTTDWIIKGNSFDTTMQSDYEEILLLYNGLSNDKLRDVALRQLKLLAEL